MATSDGDERLNASEKTIVVLEAALTNRRFTDVVAATGLARTSVHRILRTLSERGYLAVDEDGEYLPGPRALAVAARAFERVDISRLVQPVIAALVGRTDCTVHVGALVGEEVIYVARGESRKPYRMPSRIGRAIALHSTSMGKALLAGGPDDQLQRYLQSPGLLPRTPHTIIDRRNFRAELKRVQEAGFAVDDEENEPGIRCVGAAIFDHTGTASYAISVSTLALEHSLESLGRFAEPVLEAAGQISEMLGHRSE